jgi:hypothetical protein
MAVDGSSQPVDDLVGASPAEPWKGAGSASKINAEPRSSAGRREGDAVGVTEVVSGRGTRRARRRHGRRRAQRTVPRTGRPRFPLKDREAEHASGLKLFEHDRSVALVVLAPFFDGYFGPPRPAGDALRDTETFCALFADNTRWFSPFRYEVGEGRRSQFGPVVLGNSVEGGFFAVDDDRVGGVYVGDED